MRYFILILIALSACKSPSSEMPAVTTEIPVLKIVSCENIDGLLKVKFSDGTENEIALEDGKSEVVISPDGQKIAVNRQMMSNLQVSEVYSLNKDRTFDKTNISGEAWNKVEKAASVSSEEIINPRTHVVEWKSKDSVLLQVSGSTELEKRIDTVISVAVP